MYNQIKNVFTNLPEENIRIIDSAKVKTMADEENDRPKYYRDHIPDPFETDRKTSSFRKIYWYYKNLFKQKKLFKQIESYRNELGIKVFVGISAGALPLVFYMNGKPPKASVIFSNMDSWFSEVHSDMKKLWYTKYYSFNYAMENSEIVDFLSPYIVVGVKKRNVKIKEESIKVAPCSFADYSKCRVGDKFSFEIAFCARLEPDKNPLMFLEAVKILHDKYPEIKFHLLGEGTLVPEIENYINQNNLHNIVNFRFHKNPSEIFAGTSVFVSIQTNTNYPSQSVLEAMACANAIIASDTGDTNLFINSENGILIKLSTEELVRAIEHLINNRELAYKLGNNARNFVINNHTIDKYTGYFLELIQSAYKKNF